MINKTLLSAFIMMQLTMPSYDFSDPTEATFTKVMFRVTTGGQRHEEQPGVRHLFT